MSICKIGKFTNNICAKISSVGNLGGIKSIIVYNFDDLVSFTTDTEGGKIKTILWKPDSKLITFNIDDETANASCSVQTNGKNKVVNQVVTFQIPSFILIDSVNAGNVQKMLRSKLIFYIETNNSIKYYYGLDRGLTCENAEYNTGTSMTSDEDNQVWTFSGVQFSLPYTV